MFVFNPWSVVQLWCQFHLILTAAKMQLHCMVSLLYWAQSLQFCPSLCNPVHHSPTGSWDSTGKNTGVGCRALLQGIFPTQGSNPGLPNSRQILYHLLNSYYLLMIMGTTWPLFHKFFLVKTWNQVWWHVHQNVLFGSYVMEVEVGGSHLVLALSVLWSKLKDAVMSIYWVPSLCWARCLALYNHYLCNNSMNRSYSSHFTEERKVWRITSLSLPITQSAWQSRGQILACFQVMLFCFVLWNSTPWLL